MMRPITHGPRDVEAVALAFDDGPGAITSRVLDILGNAGARGTFNLSDLDERGLAAVTVRARISGAGR